jgi:hypothetical protein
LTKTFFLVKVVGNYSANSESIITNELSSDLSPFKFHQWKSSLNVHRILFISFAPQQELFVTLLEAFGHRNNSQK